MNMNFDQFESQRIEDPDISDRNSVFMSCNTVTSIPDGLFDVDNSLQKTITERILYHAMSNTVKVFCMVDYDKIYRFIYESLGYHYLHNIKSNDKNFIDIATKFEFEFEFLNHRSEFSTLSYKDYFTGEYKTLYDLIIVKELSFKEFCDLSNNENITIFT